MQVNSLHRITITAAVVLLSVTETSGEGVAHLLRRVLLAERRFAYGSWYFDQFTLAGDILYYLRDADCVRSSNEKRPLRA